MFVMRLVIVL